MYDDHSKDFRVTVCLTAGERDELERASKLTDRSMSWITRRALVDGLRDIAGTDIDGTLNAATGARR